LNAVSLISGGSRGLGLAIVEALLARGDRVATGSGLCDEETARARRCSAQGNHSLHDAERCARVAFDVEELVAAQARVDCWRSLEASNRQVERSTQ
jgi:NAD(P)-dependent dehydrogenase (short-subunit alcohol dehydrogenase family)